MSFWFKVKKLMFLLTGVSCLLFILFLTLAIIFYPGGTRFDKFYIGYNFLETFPSDLGRSIAINDQVNTISRLFFQIGITLMSLFQIYYYILFPFLLKRKRPSLILAIVGSLAGFVSSILYIGIAFNPTDVHAKLHNRLIYSSAPLVFVATIFLIAAIFTHKEFPRFFGYLYISLASAFLLFAIATLVGSLQEDNYINWVIRILGHNILIYLEGAIFAALGFGVYGYLQRKEQSATELPVTQITMT